VVQERLSRPLAVGTSSSLLSAEKNKIKILRGNFGDFLKVRYSTLLHLLPLRFLCVGERWDRTQDCCDLVILALFENFEVSNADETAQKNEKLIL
jgi:hypothetical protein